MYHQCPPLGALLIQLVVVADDGTGDDEGPTQLHDAEHQPGQTGADIRGRGPMYWYKKAYVFVHIPMFRSKTIFCNNIIKKRKSIVVLSNKFADNGQCRYGKNKA